MLEHENEDYPMPDAIQEAIETCIMAITRASTSTGEEPLVERDLTEGAETIMGEEGPEEAEEIASRSALVEEEYDAEEDDESEDEEPCNHG